ncbi:unnamed protein product [Lepeophtheirus salmonis]|uniref:(salmon louse) hypothetical protein n=1 Tax=Lepeophtheirus salmonis TaxID=72036 RepID=A0A7R8CNH1_LEPSM|nr:unnamed protein product [Lepeophtheirus salmonis]CAF2846029.1 unnamed protein product [Lepeophtheirus salmonis]
MNLNKIGILNTLSLEGIWSRCFIGRNDPLHSLYSSKFSAKDNSSPVQILFKCPFCLFKDPNNLNVKSHVVTVHKRLPYHCQWCDSKEGFKNLTTYKKKHVISNHPSVKPLPKAYEEETLVKKVKKSSSNVTKKSVPRSLKPNDFTVYPLKPIRFNISHFRASKVSPLNKKIDFSHRPLPIKSPFKMYPLKLSYDFPFRYSFEPRVIPISLKKIFKFLVSVERAFYL